MGECDGTKGYELRVVNWENLVKPGPPSIFGGKNALGIGRIPLT